MVASLPSRKYGGQSTPVYTVNGIIYAPWQFPTAPFHAQPVAFGPCPNMGHVFSIVLDFSTDLGDWPDTIEAG